TEKAGISIVKNTTDKTLQGLSYDSRVSDERDEARDSSFLFLEENRLIFGNTSVNQNMKKHFVLWLVSLLVLLPVLSISASAQTMPSGADPALWQRALKLHRSAIVIDGHNDIVSPMTDDDFDLATSSIGKIHQTDGTPFHTDLAR